MTDSMLLGANTLRSPSESGVSMTLTDIAAEIASLERPVVDGELQKYTHSRLEGAPA